MKFAGWYGIIIGILMAAQWAFFLATGQVPELESEPWRIAFHLAGEFITAVSLVVSGALLLQRKPWAIRMYLAAAGMLLYTTIVSPGYFAQLGQWPLVGMFAILAILTVVSITRLVRARNE